MDVQKMIVELIIHRVRVFIGALLMVLGIIGLGGVEETFKNTENSVVFPLILSIVIFVGGCYISKIFKWTYRLKNAEEFIGCISYSFKLHSWIQVVQYYSDDYWVYRTCTLHKQPTSFPRLSRSSFLGYLWWS